MTARSKTREEYLRWAKGRAMERVNSGDLVQAVASMILDLSKHEAWKKTDLAGDGILGLMGLGIKDYVVRWIDGFK